MLKLLLYCFLLHFVFTQSHLSHGFGKSYMRNSRLCHQWTCINDKLGLPDDLPPKEKYTEVLRGLLPQGPWQGVVKNVVDKCYEDRPRAYTNTCPGQALLHCTVDQMMQFCPESSLRKDDGCTSLQSLAGFKYMFSQSRYNELGKYLPSEHMPPWFMNNFFSSKCCNLPDMFEMDQLVECGFTSFLFIHVYKPALEEMNNKALSVPKSTSTKHILTRVQKSETAPEDDIIEIQIQFGGSDLESNDTTSTTVEISTANHTAAITPRYRVNVVNVTEPVTETLPTTTQTQVITTQTIVAETTQTEIATGTTEGSEDNQILIKDYIDTSDTQATTTTTEESIENDIKILGIAEPMDPLECCDLTDFIQPEWRSDCDFQMSWDKVNRLSIKNDSVQVTTISPTASKPQDVMVVPQPCDKTTCVFKKLNLVTSNGIFDLDGFWKLLDKMSLANIPWMKAKIRAVNKCISNPKEYEADCDINRVLACTFDLLSENCPHAKSHDPCSDVLPLREDITCQISSSKFRPKKRRLFCGIPNLVNPEVLQECGLSSLTKMEYVPIFGGKSIAPHWWNKSQYACKGLTESSKCLLKKMNVLSKYGFLDYFKMKDRIRTFVRANNVWSSVSDLYMNALTSIPMYGDQCSTTKKLLNVIDNMLSTCPISKRKNSLQCNRILTDMAATSPKLRSSQDKFSHPATPPVGRPATPPASHPATPPVAHPATPPVSHPATPPASHPVTPPVGHPATPPVGHPATPPVDHPATPPVGHPATPPVGHPSTPPFDHPATSPVGHPATTPLGQPASNPQSQQTNLKPSISSFVYNVSNHVTKQPVTHKKPLYDFGILNSKDAPKVEIIEVNPQPTKEPLVVLPVYLQMKLNGKNSTLADGRHYLASPWRK